MGQFDNYGIDPIGEIGLPKRGNRAFLERYEKPKPKTKSAPAGSPPPGPKKPGPNNNDKKDPPGGALVPRKPKPKYPSNGAANLIRK
jgi:hypothetical protein